MSITLFSTLAVRKSLDDELLEAFTKSTGIEVQVVFDPTVQLLKRIATGETFDVMIGISGSFEQLAREGVVDGSSRTAIARTGVGIAVPAGAVHPDISTEARLIDTLLAARSVAYSVTGASGIYFAQLIERLGIAERINERATIIEKGFIALAVTDGRADIAIQQLSELLFVPEAEIVGPLPAEVQHYSEFSATLSSSAPNRDEAARLIEFLAAPSAASAYRATLLEPIS